MIGSDTRKEMVVPKGQAVTNFLRVRKYLEFPEHWVDVLDDCVKTVSGHNSDSIQADTCIRHTSLMSIWFLL